MKYENPKHKTKRGTKLKHKIELTRTQPNKVPTINS